MPLSSCPAEELGLALLKSTAKLNEPEERARTARFLRAALALLDEQPAVAQIKPVLRPAAATAATSLVLMLSMAAEHAEFLAECARGAG